MGALPKFEGRPVDAVRLAFSGSDDATDEILHPGDTVTMIVRGKVTGVAHKESTSGVFRRVQSVSVDHAMPADQVTAERISKQIKKKQDDEVGQTSLDEEIDGDDE